MTATETWSSAGPRITDENSLEKIRATIEKDSPVIVEHRHYRGASAPRRFICDEFEELRRYLRDEVRPGDSIWVWSYAAV